MVGEVRGGEHFAEAVGDLRQHGSVPRFPRRDQPIEHVLAPVLQVGPLARVCHDVEQVGVVADLEVL